MSDNQQLSPAQCKAARALLGWSQNDLAEASDVAVRTVIDFEGEKRRTHTRTARDLKRTLEAAGIEFIDGNGSGPGVRFSEPQ